MTVAGGRGRRDLGLLPRRRERKGRGGANPVPRTGSRAARARGVAVRMDPRARNRFLAGPGIGRARRRGRRRRARGPLARATGRSGGRERRGSGNRPAIPAVRGPARYRAATRAWLQAAKERLDRPRLLGRTPSNDPHGSCDMRVKRLHNSIDGGRGRDGEEAFDHPRARLRRRVSARGERITRMKILYLSQYFPPEMGAPAAHAHDLFREWARLGHHVTVPTGFPITPPRHSSRVSR